MLDSIIIGCGPAGMTAAIYLLRYGKKIKIFEKENIGGQISSSPLVENYPGFTKISGSELSNNLYEQVIGLGGEIELEEVVSIKKDKDFEVTTTDGVYQAKTVIIATGSKHRLLGLPREEEFIGNGISFCVACDGAFYKDQKVCVIGGGNSAVINAITLSDICSEVVVVQNMSDLTAEKSLCDKLKSKGNVKFYFNSVVKELIGEDELTGIIVENNGIDEEIKLDGMFVSIGLIPQSEFISDMINLTDYKYVKSNDKCTTSIPGIYVAGDVRDKNVRQLTTAVSDGTVAALEVVKYLEA